LAREGHAREREDFFAQSTVEQVDLVSCAGVHAVEDAPQRPPLCVERQAGDVSTRTGSAVEQSPAYRLYVSPPHSIGVLFGPARPGNLYRVLHHVRLEHGAVETGEHPFAAVAADVKSEK